MANLQTHRGKKWTAKWGKDTAESDSATEAVIEVTEKALSTREKKMVGKTKTVIFTNTKGGCGLVLLIFFLLLPIAAIASDPPPWEQGVYQLMECSDFECGYTPGNWKYRLNADLSSFSPAGGDWSAHVGGIGSWGVIEQTIDLTGCHPGDLWVHVYRDALVSALPWPDDQWGRDYSDLWIAKGQDMVAWLYRMYDYEYSESPNGYRELWYRVTGVFDVCSGDECMLRMAAVNDGGEESVDWFWDDVEVYCLALPLPTETPTPTPLPPPPTSTPTPNYVYCPVISR